MNEIINNWDLILNTFKNECDIQNLSFTTFIKPLQVISVSDNEITLLSDTQMSANYVEKRYLKFLEVTISEIMKKDYKLRIITPDRVFYEGTADMIEFNTTEGEIGVLPGHIPMTVIIKPGVLTITEKDEVKEAALHSGFVEILPDRMTILAEVVEWPGEIDLERAEAAKRRAEERIKSHTPETDMARAETALMRAIARIQVLK